MPQSFITFKMLRISIISFTLCISGCALTTSKHTPLTQITPSQTNLPTNQAALINWPQFGWWRSYNDEQLNNLIKQAFINSPDLQTLSTRVKSSELIANGVKKLSYPTGGVKAVLSGQTYSENYIYPPSLWGEWKDSGMIASNLTWDLDLWGRNRARYRSALGQNTALQFEYKAARDTITSTIIALHAQISALAGRTDLLQKQIAIQNQAKQRWTEREQAGLQAVLSSIQVDMALAQLEQLNSTFKAQNEILYAQLSALIGAPLNSLPLIKSNNSWLTLELPNEIHANILGTRPDIAAAKYYIIAASESVKSAKAEFYPNISLSVGAGFQAIGLNKLLKAGSRYDIIEPAITLPIFSGASLNANLRNQQAKLDETIAYYNQTVYQAIKDVTEQLANQRNSTEQITQHQRLAHNLKRLSDLSLARYQQGIVPQMETLSAQSNALSQDDALQAAYATRRIQEARLAVSLGNSQDLKP